MTEMLMSTAAVYDLVRESLATRLSARFPADETRDKSPRFDVGGQEILLTDAILTVGGRDSEAFTPILGALPAAVEWLDRSDPDGVQPHLSILGTMNSLELMGLDVPRLTLERGRAWLAGQQTAGREPERLHWKRGLSALALGDLATARTVAALPEHGPIELDPTVGQGPNIQGWLSLFVFAVESGLSWEDLAPRWAEFLHLVPTFVEIGVLAVVDLPWVARAVGHGVAGLEVGVLADWTHHQIYRIAGLNPIDAS